jgi:hypothetical protein
MPHFDLIVTHPGGAHADEVLACSVLLTVHAVPIERREPATEDLDRPEVCVVDVGLRHEPERNNFDHHQLPRDHPPTCALSLVLRHLGRYDDARQFCDWLETAEWFDTRGPIETAKWLGTTNDVLTRLTSPLATTLLRRFSGLTRLEPGTPLWEMMRMTGEDIIGYIDALRSRLAYLNQHAEFWTVDLAGVPAEILFLPRTDPPLDDPSFGLDRFIQTRGLQDRIVAVVSPDRRGRGYGLERFRDNPRVDFTRIAQSPGVHFAHARGFVAKTSLTDPAELKALLLRAGGGAELKVAG